MELRVCLRQSGAGCRRGSTGLRRGLRRGERGRLAAGGRGRRRGRRRRRRRGRGGRRSGGSGRLLGRDPRRRGRRPGPSDRVSGQGGAGGDVELLLVGEGGHVVESSRGREESRGRLLVNGGSGRRRGEFFSLPFYLGAAQTRKKKKKKKKTALRFLLFPSVYAFVRARPCSVSLRACSQASAAAQSKRKSGRSKARNRCASRSPPSPKSGASRRPPPPCSRPSPRRRKSATFSAR